jgi:hypothetical protein
MLCGGLATAASAQATAALALNECPARDLPSGYCSAMLDPRRFRSRAVAALQRRSQWCWAACIEMVCRWHGVELSQESIVGRIYGGLKNMPASDAGLTAALNNVWTSDSGQRFRISSRLFSPALGRSDVDNAVIIRDLAQERPLINGARGHTTLVARVDYRPEGPRGAKVADVHVIDPSPGAARPPQYARLLERDEMVPEQFGGSLRYLASISIS